jgi:hypothetical protein
MSEFLNKEQMVQRCFDIIELVDMNDTTMHKFHVLIDFIAGDPMDIDLTKGQAMARCLDLLEGLGATQVMVDKLKVFLRHLKENNG